MLLDVDICEYESQLFECWGNFVFGYCISQVGIDGLVKFGQCIFEFVFFIFGCGEMLYLIVFIVVGYLLCFVLLVGFDLGVDVVVMMDFVCECLCVVVVSVWDGYDFVWCVIVDMQLFGMELVGQDVFIVCVGDLVDVIWCCGVDVVIMDVFDVFQIFMKEMQL